MHSNLFILSKQIFFFVGLQFISSCVFSIFILHCGLCLGWTVSTRDAVMSFDLNLPRGKSVGNNCLIATKSSCSEMSNSNCFAKDPHSKVYDHTGECFSYKLNRLMEHVIIIRTAFHSIDKVVKRPEFSISERSVWTATMQTGGWCYCFFF